MPFLEHENKIGLDTIAGKADEELLSLSVATPALFEHLVDRYEEAFLRKARRIVVEAESAEDIVQETFVKIYLNAAKFRVVPGATFKSWGYKILVNTCFTWCKKMNREKMFTANLDDEIKELVPDAAGMRLHEESLNRDLVLSLLSKLPDMLRRTATSHFVNDKPYTVIAKEEGVTENVIRTRIHRIKKQLQKINFI